MSLLEHHPPLAKHKSQEVHILFALNSQDKVAFDVKHEQFNEHTASALSVVLNGLASPSSFKPRTIYATIRTDGRSLPLHLMRPSPLKAPKLRDCCGPRRIYRVQGCGWPIPWVH